MGLYLLLVVERVSDTWVLRTMYDFHDSTDTLKFCTEKRAINRNFVFHLILMNLGKVVVTHAYYNFTKFDQNWMKKKFH